MKRPGTEESFPVFSTDTNELAFLGTGYPIYFAFLKRFSVLLTLISIPIAFMTYYQNSNIDEILTAADGQQVGDRTTFGTEIKKIISLTSCPIVSLAEYYGFDLGAEVFMNYMSFIALSLIEF